MYIELYTVRLILENSKVHIPLLHLCDRKHVPHMYYRYTLNLEFNTDLTFLLLKYSEKMNTIPAFFQESTFRRKWELTKLFDFISYS